MNHLNIFIKMIIYDFASEIRNYLHITLTRSEIFQRFIKTLAEAGLKVLLNTDNIRLRLDSP